MLIYANYTNIDENKIGKLDGKNFHSELKHFILEIWIKRI